MAAPGLRSRVARGLRRAAKITGEQVSPRTALHALASAATVTAPLAIMAALGDAGLGVALTLGAYLWTVSHMTTARGLSVRLALVTSVLLGVAGGAGFAAGSLLWLLIVLCGSAAVFQATGELAGGPLRMTAAMSALCLLLCSIGGHASAGPALRQGVAVAVGAAWAAAVDQLRHLPDRRSHAPTGLESHRLREAWPQCRSYSALLAGSSMLAAGAAGAISISHGAWLATTVLRVLRPRAEVTIPRSRSRLTGTAAAATVAAGLLAVPSHAVIAVAVVLLAVTAMMVIGPKRYGPFTFCLTLVALVLIPVQQQSGPAVALTRVILTVIGVALAIAAVRLHERLTSRAGDK
jgi:hypothetical protein